MENPLVIYHKDCADGICAALIAHQYFNGRGDYIPCQYGDAPPDVTGRDVFVLDFSFSRTILLHMFTFAKSIIVLDHHKTAEAELRDLPYCRYDMEKSGARLTLEYFADCGMPTLPYSWLVGFVEDRDLWRWQIANSREVNAALSSYPKTIDAWSDILDQETPETLLTQGKSILRYQRQLIENICANAKETEIGGHKVLAVNNATLISEVAGKLAEGRPFGVCWFHTDNKLVVSLRSRDDGIDVSEIAKKYGGGGHRNAAGYSTPCQTLL